MQRDQEVVLNNIGGTASRSETVGQRGGQGRENLKGEERKHEKASEKHTRRGAARQRGARRMSDGQSRHSGGNDRSKPRGSGRTPALRPRGGRTVKSQSAKEKCVIAPGHGEDKTPRCFLAPGEKERKKPPTSKKEPEAEGTRRGRRRKSPKTKDGQTKTNKSNVQ